MIGHLRRNVVAYIALFVALGGTSYAAVALPRGSVGTAQLKKGAVTGSKVKAHSLTATDFRTGSLRSGAKGDTGAQGPKGDTGGQGPKGDTGPAGLSTSIVSDDLPTVTDSSPTLASAVALKQVTITLPSVGRLLVLDPEIESVSFDNPTSSPTSYAYVGVYLDGNLVSGGAVACSTCSIPAHSTGSASNIQLPELSIPGVAAGSHTVTLALAGTTSADYVTAQESRLAVIAGG
jgi:hypothetical protein